MSEPRTLLIRDAALVATFDEARRELPGASIYVRGNKVEAIGPASAMPHFAEE